MDYTDAQIAHICHEANRALQIENGETEDVSPHWLDGIPPWQKDSALEGVKHARDGMSPELLHDKWCEFKTADGWTYGEQKDPVAKTHPCLVPYDDLPESQKSKDRVFGAIVAALTT